jgi:hypothetical protein
MATPATPTSAEDTPLVGITAAEAAGPALERQSQKRKEVDTSHSHRFKVVSQLVIAMKRFQGEPTAVTKTLVQDPADLLAQTFGCEAPLASLGGSTCWV